MGIVYECSFDLWWMLIIGLSTFIRLHD